MKTNLAPYPGGILLERTETLALLALLVFHKKLPGSTFNTDVFVQLPPAGHVLQKNDVSFKLVSCFEYKSLKDNGLIP